MKAFFVHLCLGMSLVCASAEISQAECGNGSSKIDDANRKFSVVVPKSAGLGEQSYDDIGCAVASRNGECATRQGMFDSGALTWDYATGEQLPVEKAYFVIKTDVKTPQSYGVVGFKDKAAAEKFSSEHGKGKVVKWFELVDEKLK
ncbi:MAG: nitrous oxide reductase accessory protein NosL [Nitrospiraceae bacterium]|nr:nitrous oxide reductase accessory protein NosL [Nitrospiraceae bacterium]